MSSDNKEANETEEEENDPLQVLIQNTYAVLKKVPKKRGEWWEALRKVQAQASQDGQFDWAVLAGALLRVVEGAAPQA